MYIENIVVGSPIFELDEETHKMFALDEEDWIKTEQEKTYFTNERFLPRILVDIGIYPSVNEIRRNRPELIKFLGKIDFIDGLKVSKKRKIWILVGK